MGERTTRDRSGGLVESHKGYDPRVMLFYFAVAGLMLTLAGGLAVQQLFKTDNYNDRERVQNQRRVLVPGPRGNIYDREGRLLVQNRPRFSVTLNLDELRAEIRASHREIRRAYRNSGDEDVPSFSQTEQIARFTVVKKYLDLVDRQLGRQTELDAKDLARHFSQRLLLPFVLVDDLAPEEYAKLLEQLPVTSPLQLYATTTRFYPYGASAAHTLGYVGFSDLEEGEVEGLPGDELKTFAMKATIGREGLERQFDERLQGETGGTIYRVDPAGYRVNPPLFKKLPVQGSNLVTSLDIDLQVVAEESLAKNELAGALAVIEVKTGEVLALASLPSFDLNDTAPRITAAKYHEIEESGGWVNRPVQGVYPPGSTFKVLTALAGIRSGWVTADSSVDCPGYYFVGAKRFVCHDGHAHGTIKLAEAVEKSCNVFFYKYGVDMGVDAMAAEARRFGFDVPTGIELPFEATRMLVPDGAWKKRVRGESWFPGDTANMSIGQGFVQVTPLQMACFVASFARRESTTPPSLLHDPQRPPLRSPPLALPAADYAAIVRGMEQCVVTGTAKILSSPAMKIQGLRFGGKTGTAQIRTVKGTLNMAWFICFAPIEDPQIAIAVTIEGDTPGEEFAGGRYAGPVAHAVLKKWWEKKQRAPSAQLASAESPTALTPPSFSVR